MNQHNLFHDVGGALDNGKIKNQGANTLAKQ